MALVKESRDAIVAKIKQCSVDDLIKESIHFTLRDVCDFYGLDLEDSKNKFFWNLNINNSVRINEEIIGWLGYSGDMATQKQNVVRFLQYKNIEYTRLRDSRKFDIIISSVDFESLVMQLRSQKADELRMIFSIIKHIMLVYLKYESMVAKSRNLMLTNQMEQLTKDATSLIKTNELMKLREDAMTSKYDELISSTRALYQMNTRLKSNLGSVQLQLRRAKYEEEQAKEELQNIYNSNNNVRVTRKMTTNTESQKQNRQQPVKDMSLFNIAPNSWYIMRRKRRGFAAGRRHFIKSHPGSIELKTWLDVPNVYQMKQNTGLPLLYSSNKIYARINQSVSNDMIVRAVDNELMYFQ